MFIWLRFMVGLLGACLSAQHNIIDVHCFSDIIWRNLWRCGWLGIFRKNIYILALRDEVRWSMFYNGFRQRRSLSSICCAVYNIEAYRGPCKNCNLCKNDLQKDAVCWAKLSVIVVVYGSSETKTAQCVLLHSFTIVSLRAVCQIGFLVRCNFGTAFGTTFWHRWSMRCELQLSMVSNLKPASG